MGRPVPVPPARVDCGFAERLTRRDPEALGRAVDRFATWPCLSWTGCRRLLEADPATPGIPVIVLTAHAGQEDRVAAKGAGCISLLTRPVEDGRVAGEVPRMLTMREAAAPWRAGRTR